MKLEEAEVILRFRVTFNKEETAYLRSVGHLPPKGSEFAELWVTVPELEVMKEMFPTMRDEITSLLTQIRALASKFTSQQGNVTV